MKLKKILPQFLTLLFIVLIFGFFTMNAQENMDTRGIEFGFGFLKQEASFDIQFSLIDYDGSKSYARAYLVGLLNTLLVSVIGIILCTILGVVIGVARLSPNYLINRTASVYIEFFRNIPLLLQIFFWYFAALRALPMPEDASLLLGTSYMTIKGLYTPAPIWNIKYRIPAAKALSVLLAHIRNTEATAATSKNMNKVIISPAKTAAIAPPA